MNSDHGVAVEVADNVTNVVVGCDTHLSKLEFDPLVARGRPYYDIIPLLDSLCCTVRLSRAETRRRVTYREIREGMAS